MDYRPSLESRRRVPLSVRPTADLDCGLLRSQADYRTGVCNQQVTEEPVRSRPQRDAARLATMEPM